MPGDSLADAVAAQRWYHTIELPGGLVTPGEYDLRPIVAKLPWPSLAGKRCLDIGSRDGFYAFEMERRGAASVVSLDLNDPAQIDFPGFRPDQENVQRELDVGNAAFELAKSALRSSVERRFTSVYDLDPIEVGTFDFALIGTLLLHLRDPARAMAGIRRVVNGDFLMIEATLSGVDLYRRKPIARIFAVPGLPFWFVANPAGLVQLVGSAGFRVTGRSKPFLIPPGPGTDHHGRRQKPARHTWISATTDAAT